MKERSLTSWVYSLHSAEVKKRIERYCIGKIGGRWKNFLPPVQGGKYRKITNNAPDEYEINNIAFPSSSSDSALLGNAESRNRRYEVGFSNSESTCSSTGKDDGMAHLDSLTREKISLDLDKYPGLDPAVQDQIVFKYRLLEERVKAEGLYQCNYWAYMIELWRYSFLFVGMLLCLRWGWYALSGICMGAFWHQLAFVAHDAGHMGITHNYHTDTVIGILIADFMGGLSICWWKRNHNVHHIVTSTSRLPLIRCSQKCAWENSSPSSVRQAAFCASRPFFKSC